MLFRLGVNYFNERQYTQAEDYLSQSIALNNNQSITQQAYRGREVPGWRENIVCEFHGHHFPLQQRMLRTREFKLVVNHESINDLSISVVEETANTTTARVRNKNISQRTNDEVRYLIFILIYLKV